MFFGLFKKKNEVAVAKEITVKETEHRGTLFLVDFENVHDEGLEGVEDVRTIDHVIIFYGPLIKTIGFETHLAVGRSKALVEHFKTYRTAKNYLDFQLTTYLGYLLATGHYENIRIISKDTGFDSVVDFWSARDIDIKRRKTITLAMAASDADEKPERIAENKTEIKAEPKQQENKNMRPVKTGVSLGKNGKKPEAKPYRDHKPANDNKTVEKKEVKPEVKTETKVEAKPEVKTETKVEVKSEVKPEAKPEVKAEAKPETKSEAEIEEKIDVKPEIKAEEKAETKPEIKTEEKVEVKPEIKTEEKKEAKPEKAAPEEKPETKKTVKAGSVPEPTRKKIRAALKDMQLVASNYTSIYKAMAASDDKNDYHNALMKTFGNEKAAEIYKRTKAIFADYQ